MSTDRTYCGTPRAATAGQQATAFGWVDRRRDHGGLIFIDLRDHTGILQVVIDPNDAPEAHRAATRRVSNGCCASRERFGCARRRT